MVVNIMWSQKHHFLSFPCPGFASAAADVHLTVRGSPAPECPGLTDARGAGCLPGLPSVAGRALLRVPCCPLLGRLAGKWERGGMHVCFRLKKKKHTHGTSVPIQAEFTSRAESHIPPLSTSNMSCWEDTSESSSDFKACWGSSGPWTLLVVPSVQLELTSDLDERGEEHVPRAGNTLSPPTE